MNDPFRQIIDRAFEDLCRDASDPHIKRMALTIDIQRRHIDLLTRERDYYKMCAEFNHGVLMGRMQ